ncbi:UNVERIFIED_CONTAM: hypothetical protein K2H54_069833 [Gekko kuhli]
MTSQTDEAEKEMAELLKEIGTLDEKRNQESSNGLVVQKETIATIERASSLVRTLENVLDNVQELDSEAKHYHVAHDLAPEDAIQKRKAAEEMLKDLRLHKPLTTQRLLADEESDAAQKLLGEAAKLQQKHNETRSLIPIILDQLEEYNIKLTDVQEALEQAFYSIIKSETLNKESADTLQENEKTLETVAEEIKYVNSTLLSARDILNVQHQINFEMGEGIKNTSGFYAEIDGAKIHLQDKLANLSRFDDDMVQTAMEHAQKLQDLADELER